MSVENSKETFICDNINELNIQQRKEILQIIYDSSCKDLLKEKGNGTQIKISSLTDNLKNKIHEFIVKHLDSESLYL
jgi:hypothetical protein